MLSLNQHNQTINIKLENLRYDTILFNICTELSTGTVVRFEKWFKNNRPLLLHRRK